MNFIAKYIVALLFFWLPLETIASEFCDNGLVVGWEDWPPYQYIDGQGHLTGVDIEIARLVFKEMDCPLTFVEVPWKRHLKSIERGDIHLALGSSLSEDREKYSYFSSPYRQELVSLFVKKSEANQYVSLMDFLNKGKYLGTTLGYYYGEKFNSLVDSKAFASQLKQVRDDTQLFQMLGKNRIDGFLADTLAVSHQAQDYPQILQFMPVLHTYSAHIHFMLSKQSVAEGLVKEVNYTLEQLKSNRKLYEVFNRYVTAEHRTLPFY